jgi:hypothetical protein
MLHLARSSSLIPLTALVALVGCGGGGGGGGSSANTAPAGFATTTPSAAETGLPVPTLELALTTQQMEALVSDLLTAYGKSGAGVAARVLGQLAPGAHPNAANCSSGSRTGNPINGYTYTDCTYDGYTFTGAATATVDTSASTYTLNYTNLSAKGPNGLNTALSGNTTCTIVGTAAKCIATNSEPVATNAEFKWGWDTALVNGVANGTHACGCAKTWNVTYYDFTGSSGKAIIKGNNGTAYITRNNASNYDVRLIVGSQGQDFNVTSAK